MGIVFRQSVKTSFVVLTGAILGGLIIWLSTQYIGKQPFGFTRNLTSQAILLSNLLLIGSGHVLIVYIHRFANDDRKRKLLLTLCLFLPLITTALASILYFSLRTWILHHFQEADVPLMQRYFIWLPIYTVLFIYMSVLELYLGSQMKVAIAAFMREVVLRILNVILLLLFAYQLIDFSVLVVGSILIYLVPVIIFLALSVKTEAFGISFSFRDFSKAEYKEIIHFSWYHFLLVISTALLATLDILSLPFYDHKGLISVAIYGVAVYLISFLQLPSKAMTTASFTVLAKAFADNDLPKAKDIFVRSSINFLIPTLGIAILLCCNLENAITVIKNGYSEIIPVFLILFVGALFNIATGMNDMVLSIANYYKFNFYLSLVLIIILFFSLKFFVPIYGVYGAAFSTTATIIVFNIAKLLFIWKKLDMQPFSRNTVLILIAALPAFVAGYFFPHFFDQARHVYIRTVADVAIRSTLIVVVYMAMLLWLKPSKDLEEYIASIKKNKRLF